MSKPRRAALPSLAPLGVVLAAASVLSLACSGDAPPAEPAAAGPPGKPPVAADPVTDRLVVVHVPGLDPDLVERWRADLPLFDRLAPGRSLPRLDFDPPGYWSHLAAEASTGRRGGAAGTIGGPRVDPATMTLTPARIADEARTVPPYWEIAARAGISTRALWVPGALPDPATPNLHLVPEAVPSPLPKGAICVLVGDASPPLSPELGMVMQVEGDGPWTVEIPLGDEVSWQLELSQPRPDGYRVALGGVQADLRTGELGSVVSASLPRGAGVGRVMLRMAATKMGEGTGISILSAGVAPGGDTPVTVPAGFADEWEGFHGPIDTTGGAWNVLDGLSAGLVSPGHLARAAEEQLDARATALVDELARRDARLVVANLPEAGIAGIGLLGFSDPNHPGWSGTAAVEYGGVTKSIYARLDSALGRVRDALQPGDRLIVVSDRGIVSTRYLVDLNASLASIGAIKGGPAAGQAPAALGADLPWSQANSFAMGPGYVYVNAQGRFSEGAVPANRVERERVSVARHIAGLRHDGKKVVEAVRTGAELFPGLDEARRPDLVVRFADGFDIAPTAFHGGVGGTAVIPNTSGLTTGLGATAADLRGFAVTTFGAVPADAHLVDIAPTVLSLLGVGDGAELDGRVWTIGFARPDGDPTAP